MKKEYWFYLVCGGFLTAQVFWLWKTMSNREKAWNMLGIWVVAAGMTLLSLILTRCRPKKNPLSWYGLYLVLGPLSLMAWLKSSFEMWFVVPFSLAGVIILWFAQPQTEKDGHAEILTKSPQ